MVGPCGFDTHVLRRKQLETPASGGPISRLCSLQKGRHVLFFNGTLSNSPVFSLLPPASFGYHVSYRKESVQVRACCWPKNGDVLSGKETWKFKVQQQVPEDRSGLLKSLRGGG